MVLNDRVSGYNQELRDQLHRLLAQMHSEIWLNRRGGIFLLIAEQLQPEDRVLLQSTARVVLSAGQQSLDIQLSALRRQADHLPAFAPERPAPAVNELLPPLAPPDHLDFANGLGGFSPDGREYVIYLEPGRLPPAPWINVVANPEFGFSISESGGGYTWSANSGENRLTPWANDPVADQPGEVLYLRDEETSEVWSVTPQPRGAATLRWCVMVPATASLHATAMACDKTCACLLPPTPRPRSSNCAWKI